MGGGEESEERGVGGGGWIVSPGRCVKSSFLVPVSVILDIGSLKMQLRCGFR